jgi:hypothetical protein
MKVRLFLHTKCEQKLQFVKILHENTRIRGYGLVNCKNICEDIFDNFETGNLRNVEFEVDDRDKLFNDLKEVYSVSEFSLNGGIQHDRDVKILQLGLGEKEDYVNYFIENIKFLDDDQIIKLFNNISVYLTNDNLKETFNKLL